MLIPERSIGSATTCHICGCWTYEDDETCLPCKAVLAEGKTDGRAIDHGA